MRRTSCLLVVCLSIALHINAQPQCTGATQEAPFKPPHTISRDHLGAYETEILTWLQGNEYAKLGWCVDKGVRDTGPWINGTYFGTHKAVRIYYSPGVMTWLTGGRTGTIPDGLRPGGPRRAFLDLGRCGRVRDELRRRRSRHVLRLGHLTPPARMDSRLPPSPGGRAPRGRSPHARTS